LVVAVHNCDVVHNVQVNRYSLYSILCADFQTREMGNFKSFFLNDLKANLVANNYDMVSSYQALVTLSVIFRSIQFVPKRVLMGSSENSKHQNSKYHNRKLANMNHDIMNEYINGYLISVLLNALCQDCV